MPDLPFQAVVFDMDGLMLDTERISERAWALAAETLHLQPPADFFQRVIGMNLRAIRLFLEQNSPSDFPLQAFINQAETHYRELLVQGIPHKPGLLHLLDWLQERRYPLAVATSTQQAMARQKLQSAGILDRFATVVTGDQVEHGKPAPDIYLLAAQRLGKDPQQCLALEDSQHGIHSAASAGMRVIHIPDICHIPESTRQLAWQIFARLDDVPAHLESCG